MIRKIVLTITAFVLCSAASFAIDKDKFLNMLNYANCKYTAAYLQNHTDKKELIDIINNVTIENPFTCDQLCQLLEVNNLGSTARGLSQPFFDKRKNKYDDSKSEDEILGILELTLFSKFLNLGQTTESLKKDFTRYLNPNATNTNREMTQEGDKLLNLSLSVNNQDNTLKTITINNKKVKLKVGLNYDKLTYSTDPTNYHAKKVEWSSDDNKVIQITDKTLGKIKVLKKGSAKITVMVDGKEDTWEVTTVEDNAGWNKFLIPLFLFIIPLFLAGLGFLAFKLRVFYRQFKQTVSNKTGNTDDDAVVNKPKDKNMEHGISEPEKRERDSFELEEKDYEKIADILLQDKRLLKYLLEDKRLWEYVKKALSNEKNVSSLIQETIPALTLKGIDFSNIENKIESHPTPPHPSSQNVLYANTIINGGVFHKVTIVPTEDTIFELKKTLPNRAIFRIYPRVYEKVLKRPDFLEGCDVQRTGDSTVETVEPGEAVLEYNTWKIKRKAKIKFT